ncbi:MAG: hypothetical protein ONB46_15595 [candidate division KSB1 bacterium]|nr:hypothetical protein [candidate division KSB1 bacterium]MDZ7367140.1 hypothetical protein [candidate division KSB1 bacterium]MDZ7405118.1 hypothetical protein [candidate division KSB1 bacterium]
MRQDNQFRIILSEFGGDPMQQLRFFALLNLGIVQSLASGVISAAEAVQLFYNAENCLYVRQHFRNKEANAIMSHGVQLPDLFECLSTEEASHEFFYELETIRSLCMNLLAEKRSTRKGLSPGVVNRVTV